MKALIVLNPRGGKLAKLGIDWARQQIAARCAANNLDATIAVVPAIKFRQGCNRWRRRQYSSRRLGARRLEYPLGHLAAWHIEPLCAGSGAASRPRRRGPAHRVRSAPPGRCGRGERARVPEQFLAGHLSGSRCRARPVPPPRPRPVVCGSACSLPRSLAAASTQGPCPCPRVGRRCGERPACLSPTTYTNWMRLPALRGCGWIPVNCAFTLPTGKADWHSWCLRSALCSVVSNQSVTLSRRAWSGWRYRCDDVACAWRSTANRWFFVRRCITAFDRARCA